MTWADRAQAACETPCALDATLSNVRAHVALQRGDSDGAAQWAARAATRPAARLRAREYYQRAIDVYQAAGNASAADGVRQRLAALPASR